MSSNVSQETVKLTKGMDLPSAVIVQGGADGQFFPANQIAWGESTFKDQTFGGTSTGLLNAIETAIGEGGNGFNKYSIPILDPDKIDEIEVKPDKYFTIETPNQLYNQSPTGDVYINQMFAAIRALQAEVNRLKNSFKYGIESYQGKETTMSNVVGEYNEIESEEPMWAISEDSLNEIPDYQFKLATGHSLVPATNVEIIPEGLSITNEAKYTELNVFKDLTETYLYFFITTRNLKLKVKFKNFSHNDDENDIILDFSKIQDLEDSPFKKNILIVLSKAHLKENTENEFVGKNYIYTSITHWDTNETIFDGYIIDNGESLVPEDETKQIILSSGEYIFNKFETVQENIYYPVEFTFTDNILYKFNVYTKQRDFNNTVLPTIPSESNNDKYKVAHLTIRAFDTYQDAKDTELQLLENELCFITDTNKLYIKSKGSLVGISGSASTDDDTDTGDNDMEDIVNSVYDALEGFGIKLDNNGNTEFNNIGSITFKHESSGKTFKFECNAYGELVSSELNEETTLEKRIQKLNTNTLSADFDNYRGFFAQLNLRENNKDILLTSDALGLSDRIKIGAFYAPLKTDKIFGCSHGFIELVNCSTNDLNLAGCYLHYYHSDIDATGSVSSKTHSLLLTGILPAGGTYLIRCKQYANFDDANVFIKVNTFDQEWYISGDDGKTKELLDLTMQEKIVDKDENVLNGYGFLLTYGNTYLEEGAETTIDYTTVMVRPKSAASIDKIKTNKDAKYIYRNNFIDAICFLKSSQWVGATVESVNSNSITKLTFMLDPAKQALNGLFGKDSSRIRWTNNATDIQYLNLDNEYISFKHSEEIYPVSLFTPKASFEHKNVCTDKTKLNKNKPNSVFCSFGNNSATTRCFNWVSAGVFNEYVWLKNVNGAAWTKIESYKEISKEITNTDPYPRRKEFPVELNNAGYARIINRFPGEGSLYCSHKCIIEFDEAKTDPIKYEYVVGRADRTGDAPDMLHCSDVMSFTLYPKTYTPIIYQITDQQGFHWIEYQVWNAAANKLEEKIKADCEGEGKTCYPVIINTGDVTQNGTRINEWLDYYNGGYNLFSKYEHMSVVGNNDLCDIDPTILGTGDDIGKSNGYFFHVFNCYDTDITKDTNKNYNIPLPLCNGKYIPSLYYFDLYFNYIIGEGENIKECNQQQRIIMLNSEITKVTCEKWFNIKNANSIPVNIYTGFTIEEGDSSVYVANELGFTPIYEMVYAMTGDTSYKYIVVCHESPFTVITRSAILRVDPEGSTTPYQMDRSLTTSLVGSHLNIIHKNNANATGSYWLSRLLEFRGIKLCLCGHKHTYACTYPVREYFQFYKVVDGVGQWLNSKDNYKDYTMPASLKDEYGTKVVNEETKTGNLINWVWDEYKDYTNVDGQSDTFKLENLNHTKMPLTKVEIQNNLYDSDTPTIIYPFTPVADLKNGVRYFMCQATGYKLTSNKELPSQDQKFSEFIPKTNHKPNEETGKIEDKPDGNQRRPMFAIIMFTKDNVNDFEVKLARIENILGVPNDDDNKFTFNQTYFNTIDMTLKYLKNETETDGYGNWVENETVLFTC